MDDMKILIDGKEFDLKSGFVGGTLDGLIDAPIGMYYGELNLGKMNLEVMTALRSIIKICHSEFYLNYEGSKKFIELALDEAIRREKLKLDDISLNKHQVTGKQQKDKF